MTDADQPSPAGPLDVCVVGSLNVDIVVRVGRLPERGETVVGTSSDTYLGGKGFNQAVAAARAGARTALVGAVGDDEHGRRLLAVLSREAIVVGGVHVLAGAGTGMAFPVVDDAGENTIIVVPRANHEITVADVERQATTITRAGVVLLQLELPLDVVVAAATVARRAGATVVLNPAPAVATIEPFSGLVDVIVPNESELTLLARADGADPGLAAAVLRETTGATSIVVTLGDRGALLSTPTTVTTVTPHAVATVDTVGAGDAFCGVLAARLAAGASVAEAVQHANAAGALATTRHGAEPSMPSRAEIDELLVAGGRPTIPTRPPSAPPD